MLANLLFAALLFMMNGCKPKQEAHVNETSTQSVTFNPKAYIRFHTFWDPLRARILHENFQLKVKDDNTLYSFDCIALGDRLATTTLSVTTDSIYIGESMDDAVSLEVLSEQMMQFRSAAVAAGDPHPPVILNFDPMTSADFAHKTLVILGDCQIDTLVIRPLDTGAIDPPL